MKIDEKRLQESEKILMMYLQDTNLIKENVILKENLTIALHDVVHYIYYKSTNRLATKRNTVEIVAYLIYAIAGLCKNKPEVLRPAYSVAGGIVYSLLMWKLIYEEIDDKKAYYSKTALEKFFGSFSLNISLTLLKLTIDATSNLTDIFFSPTTTTDIRKKITASIFPVASAFIISFAASFIFIGMCYKAAEENKDITEINFIDFLTSTLREFYNLFKKLTFLSKITLIHFLYTNLKTIFSLASHETHSRNARKKIINKIIENSKQLIERQMTNELENDAMKSSVNHITVQRVDVNKLVKTGYTNLMVRLLEKELGLVNLYPILVTDKDKIYLLNKANEYEEDRIQKFLTAITNCEISFNEKLNISFLKDVSNNIIILCGTFNPLMHKLVLAKTKERGYSLLNGFALTLNDYNITTFLLNGKKKNTSFDEPTVESVVSEFILLHEAGHQIMSTDYFAYQSATFFSLLSLMMTRSINRSSYALLRSAVTYLGYVTSVHTELEADAFAAYMLGDENKVKYAFNVMKHHITSGSLDDPHSTSKIRLLSALKQVKKGKNNEKK